MNIGIIIAVPDELKSFLESKFKVETLDDKVRTTYKINVNNNNVYVTTSGYGKVDASSATQFLITKFDCKKIINYGVTGALDKSLKVEDLFVVNKTINYDFDISQIEPVKKHQYLGFDDEYITLDKELICLAKSIDKNLKDATVASGDKFVDDKAEKESMNINLNANICDMEIAGIAKTCHFNKVPCLSIKCISDTFDGNGKDFHENVSRSASLAFKIIEQILEKL